MAKRLALPRVLSSSMYFCAATTEAANTRPLGPLPAFCEAALYTFSSTRGTTIMMCGRATLRSEVSVLMPLAM